MNTVTLKGIVKSIPEATKYGNFEFGIGVNRISGVEDEIKVVFKPENFDYDVIPNIRIGETIAILGELISYAVFDENTQSTRTAVRVRAKSFATGDAIEEEFYNEVQIDGKMMTKPTLRKTPLNHTIVDFRVLNKEKYRIPCIAWNGIAKAICANPKMERIACVGRLQAREYTKMYADGTMEVRTTYEVSIGSFAEVE